MIARTRRSAACSTRWASPSISAYCSPDLVSSQARARLPRRSTPTREIECVERGPEEADVAVAGAQGGQTRNLPLDCATRNQHVEELADRSGPSTQSDCLPIGPFARAAELGQTLGATLGNGATAEAEPPGKAAQVEEAEHAANRGRAGRNASRSKMSPELARAAGPLIGLESRQDGVFDVGLHGGTNHRRAAHHERAV